MHIRFEYYAHCISFIMSCRLKTASMAEDALADYVQAPSSVLDAAVEDFALTHGGVHQAISAATAIHGQVLTSKPPKPSVLAGDLLQDEALPHHARPHFALLLTLGQQNHIGGQPTSEMDSQILD